jgi:hypothetical protein
MKLLANYLTMKWITAGWWMIGISLAGGAPTAFRLGQDSTLLNQYYNSPNSYPTTKSQTSYLHFDGNLNASQRSLFATDDIFYEVGTYDFGSEFNGTEIVNRLRNYETYGWNIAGVFCYRENWLENRELGGPYPVDRRILSRKEITDIRNAFKNANPPLASQNVKLVQLIGGRAWGQNGDSWLRLTDEMKEHLKQFDGVGIECHIGDHDPNSVQDAQETVQAMAAMAKWAIDNGKLAFVFMGGDPTTYVDIAYTQQTYHYLWAEMIKQGVDYKSDQLVYFRQGARAGNHTPESANNTLTHQMKWVIDAVGNNLPAIRPIANQTLAENTSHDLPFTLGAELVAAYAEPVFSIHSSNPALLPSANIKLGGSGANRTITLLPVANQIGNATVTIRASIAPFSVSQQFSVAVLDAVITTAAVNGAITEAPTWGGTGPVSGDRHVWQSGLASLRMAAATETFHGDTLEIQSGGQFAPGIAAANLTLRNLNLSGGEIGMGNNLGLTLNLSGKRMALNSGTLRSGSLATRFIKIGNASLTGNGTISIASAGTANSEVEFLSTVDTRGFSGMFHVSGNGVFNLPAIPATNASFGLTISGTGKYKNDADVAVTSLTIGDTTYTSGTFAYADFPTVFFNSGGVVRVVPNAAPTMTTVANQTLSEDVPSPALAFTIGDDLVDPGNLVLEAFSSNTTLLPDSNLILGGSAATRTISVLPAPHQSGTATVTLRVSDGISQAIQTFVVTVNPVNDPPEMSPVSNQISNGSSPVQIPFNVTDNETVVGSLTISRASSNTTLVPVANVVLGGSGTNRTVTVTPVSGQTGKTIITLTVNDGTATSTRTFVYAVVSGTGPISAVQSGLVNADSTWSTGAAPMDGDTRRWNSGNLTLNMTNTPYARFHGASLHVQSGGTLTGSTFGPLLEVNDLVLDGGQIVMNNNGGMDIDLTGHTFTLNSGSIKSGGDNAQRDINVANGFLAGSGTIEILGTNTTGSNVEIEKGVTTKGFTGVFDVKSNGILNLPPITVGNASFGLTLFGTGKLWNDSSIAVRSLVIGGSIIEPGTYTYNSFSTAQKAFLFDNGGSITVVAPSALPPTISSVPDQSTREGIPSQAISFTLSGGADVNSLTMTGISQNPALVPNGNFQFSGSGATRTVVITPTANQSGTANIQLVVSDGNLSASTTFSLTVTPAAQFVDAVAEGSLTGTGAWNRAAPVLGDTDIWRSGSLILDMKNNATQTFHGEFLVIESGGQLAPGTAAATLTMNHLILDGGTIVQQNNLPFRILLGGKTFTLNGGSLKAGSLNDNRDLRFENGSLAGNGTILIQNAAASGIGSGSEVEFTATVLTAGFTGTFEINNNGLLNLPPIATASFGLTLSGSGKYWNDAPVSVTSLSIAGTTFPPGTYTYATIGAAYQSFLGNNGGSITVVSPSTRYADWVTSHDLNGSEIDDDDGDGIANLVEYALGGNPNNSSDRGSLPTFTRDVKGLNFTHVKRSAPGESIRYNLQISDHLAPPNWTTLGSVVIGVRQLSPDFESITHRISTLPDSKKFIRLKIENP